MALAESFELILSVLESGIFEEVISEVMGSPEGLAVTESSDSFKSAITGQLDRWKYQLKEKLLVESSNDNLDQEVEYFHQVNNYSDEYFFDNIDSIIEKLDINYSFHEQAKSLMKKQNKKYNPLFKDHFCDTWYQKLFDDLQESQRQALQKEKQKLLADLYQRQETISQLSEIDNTQNSKRNMRLWDMAKAKLSQIDIRNLKKMVVFLKKHDELQKIAKQLGRMANNTNDPDLNRVEIQKNESTPIDTYNNSGELVGIRQSNDLERLLPAELMFLAYPELEVIFYKHLAENRLATYQQKSTLHKNEKVITYEQQNKQANQDKGPFIIAIDASGSMMGQAEQCAKAFSYGLMQIALAEERSCFIIIFSVQQITYELTKNNGLTDMLNFLSYSFSGGTDISSVLERSFTLMQTQHYKNADLIVLSDFIAPTISNKTLTKLNAMKDNKNRFHALSLSRYENKELLAIFDNHWNYNPSRLARFKRLFTK